MFVRTFLRKTCNAGLLALVATTQPVIAAPQAGEADVVYKNGFIYTVDPVRTRAQAFALRDGKFLAVGSNDGMKAVSGKDTTGRQRSRSSPVTAPWPWRRKTRLAP